MQTDLLSHSPRFFQPSKTKRELAVQPLRGTLWTPVFLHERPGYAYKAGAAAEYLSRGTISADEKSMCRALNRFETFGLVARVLRESEIGPKHRCCCMTCAGADLLAAFLRRNILVFDHPSVRERIRAVSADGPGGEKSG